MTREPKISPRQSEYLRSHTRQEATAAKMFQHRDLAIPYLQSVKIYRGQWRCQRCGYQTSDEENAKIHNGLFKHILEQMSYEVDIVCWGTEAIEITGAGSSSLDPERVQWFKEHMPHLRFWYFSNETIERRPEEFVQFCQLLKSERAARGLPH